MNNEVIKEQEEGISLLEIFKTIKSHIIAILIFIIFCLGGGVLFAYLSPTSYHASMQVYILNSVSGNPSTDQIIDSLRIIDTFKDFIVDTSVAKLTVEKVHDADSNININYQSVISGISTSMSSENSVCVVLSYTSNDPHIAGVVLENVILSAQEIASSEGEFQLFNDMITIPSQPSITNFGNGETAEISETKASKVLYGFIGGVIGIVLGLAYAFIREAIDNTITSTKYIEEKYNIKVIGIIPEILDGEGGNK